MSSRRKIGWAILTASVLLPLIVYGAVFSQQAAVPTYQSRPLYSPENQVPSANVPSMPVPASISNAPQRPVSSWGPSYQAANPAVPAQQPVAGQPVYRAVQTADGLLGIVAQPAAGSSDPFGVPQHKYAVQVDPEMTETVKADEAKGKEVLELVKQYKAAAGEAPRAEVKEKLETLVNEHFDIRQKRRELEISRLEERLAQIRAALEKRNEARQLIVDRHIAELLGLGDDLAF